MVAVEGSEPPCGGTAGRDQEAEEAVVAGAAMAVLVVVVGVVGMAVPVVAGGGFSLPCYSNTGCRHAGYLPEPAVAAFLETGDNLAEVGVAAIRADKGLPHNEDKVQVLGHDDMLQHLSHRIMGRDAG